MNIKTRRLLISKTKQKKQIEVQQSVQSNAFVNNCSAVLEVAEGAY